MNSFTCIIVDDEPLARQTLISYVEKIPYLEVIATCQNAIEAKLAIQENNPDILFIDIQMPHLTGIELLKMLKHKPATVLTTAYTEYAIESYELEVIDYLLKPIEFERFFKATNKCMEWLSKTKDWPKPQINVLSHTPELSEAKANYLFVKADYKLVKIVFDEIIYIEALQKYVRIHTIKERIITLISMSELESMLPSNQFCRIHRSHIINIKMVENIDGYMVSLGKVSLPISRGKRESFLELLKGKL
jgi:DNA-binding LytR/AlgR family response regulator